MRTFTIVSRAFMFVIFTATFSVILPAQLSHAHNKVVVIPMAGDDVEVPAKIIPTTPIANANTDQNDYTIGALTAIDKTTLLEWQRMDDGVDRNWDNAWSYCVSIVLNNHQDWRLPMATEIQSIADYGSVASPFIDPVAFTISSGSGFYWSATTKARDSASAWAAFGGFIGTVSKSGSGLVRCVR